MMVEKITELPLGFIFCITANHPHSDKSHCCSAIPSWTNTISVTCLDIEGNMFAVPKIQRQFCFSVSPAMTLVTDFVRKIKAEVRMDWETSNELKSCSCSVHCYWCPWIISDIETVKTEQMHKISEEIYKTSPQKQGSSRCCQGLKVNLQSKHIYFFHLFSKKG